MAGLAAAVAASMAIVVAMLTAWPGSASAQRMSLVRDAEIEASIRDLATPLLQAASLAPQDVRIHLVNDGSLNAFVAGGLRVFLHTGLLQRAETPNQLAGVLAHEIGHIAGGHLARTREEMRGASATAIIAAVMGVAAAVAAGDARVGAAVASAGQDAARRNLLQYSRTQESAADQSALRLLEATGQSAIGLAQFLGVLGDQELLSSRLQDPYLRTHPFSRDRVNSIEAHLRRSPYTNRTDSAEAIEAHDRMRAKLVGFLEPVGTVWRLYPETDASMPATYARAVAYHRRNDWQAADAAVAALLRMRPNDPYFWELKGQLLFERGDADGAVAAYRKAVAAAPNQPLIAIGYARAATQLGEPTALAEATKRLERALVIEKNNGSAWRVLGTAYGMQGNMGEAALALAESEWHFGNAGLVVQQAGRAQSLLPRGSPGWLRAEDLRLGAERQIQRRRQ